MRPKVHIDGHVGTTGLRIRDWLRGRGDLEVLDLPETSRKDPAARRERVDEADVAVLCLPDDAAREAAAWAAASGTRVVDASTDLQLARAEIRGQQSREELEQIIQSQATREERLALADDVIENSGSIDELLESVNFYHQKYVQLAKSMP